MGRTKKVQDGLQYEEEKREETEVTAPEPEAPKVEEPKSLGYAMMEKNGVTRRVFNENIEARKADGWKVVK